MMGSFLGATTPRQDNHFETSSRTSNASNYEQNGMQMNQSMAMQPNFNASIMFKDNGSLYNGLAQSDRAGSNSLYHKRGGAPPAEEVVIHKCVFAMQS